MTKETWLIFACLAILILITFPIFLDIYRIAVFNTVPRDDYAPYLLNLIGQGGEMPTAPFVYRVISVAIAIPFYYILPTYTFTNLSNVDISYLKATQALCFSSYLSLVLTAVVIYAISRNQFFATKTTSLIAGLLSFFLSNFISRVGIDPFAILIISLLVLWLNNPVVFALLILTSILINEKIPILFATILVFRFLDSIVRQYYFKYYVQLYFSCLAVISYFAITFILKIPGNENQVNPTLFLSSLQSSLIYTISLKGLFLNALPVLLLLLIVMFAIQSRRQNFRTSDVSGMFVLLVLACIADVVYNIGRIVMYSYPLYLPAAICFAVDILVEKEQQ